LTENGSHAGFEKSSIGREGGRRDPFSTMRIFEKLGRGPTNLPAQPTPLVDREKEFMAVRGLLQSETRLVTLTGPGGTGKTRLALEIASTLVDNFPGGVFLIPLARITDPGLVPSEIVSTLGVTEKGGQSIGETIKEFLRDKAMLLVLDNFEQVVSAAPIAAELLHECPKLKILVTSRTPLRIRGEHELLVHPLALPEPEKSASVDVLLSSPSVRLFVQRAKAVRPEFELTPENARTVAEVCIRVDGLPLALELAAVRIRIMSPEIILKRLEKRLGLLTGGAQDLPARQRTLRDTIAWSYDLLDPIAKKVFRRVSVFVGGFSLDAAQSVCGTFPDGDVDALDSLSKLVEGNLVYRVDAGGEMRFGMLETIREFALESLETAGESGKALEAYSNFFLEFAEKAEPELRRPDQAEWLTQLDRDHDNLRAVIRWSIENGNVDLSLRLASHLWRFWYIRGHWAEGRVWIARTIDKSGSTQSVARAKALFGNGVLASVQDDFPAAHSLLDRSLALFRELGDKEGIAFALNSLAIVARSEGDLSGGMKLQEDSLALMREIGNKWGIALVLMNMGVGQRAQGDHAKAAKLHEQSLQLFRELGDKRYIARMLINLGIDSRDKGDLKQSRRLLTESLSLSREMGEKIGIAESLLYLGSVAKRQGEFSSAVELLRESLAVYYELGDKEGIATCFDEYASCDCARGAVEHATRLMGACDALREFAHVPIPPAYRADHERDVTLARTKLRPEEFDVEWANGRVMTLEQAVKFVLGLESERV